MARRLSPLAYALALACCALTARAQAQDGLAEQFSKRGRILVGGSVQAWGSNVRSPDTLHHNLAWLVRGQLEASAFVVDHVALGLATSGGSQRIEGSSSRRSDSRLALQALFHVPISGGHGIQLRTSAGPAVIWRRPTDTSGRARVEGLQGEKAWTMRVEAGVEWIVHLTPSLALYAGPGLDLTRTLPGSRKAAERLNFLRPRGELRGRFSLGMIYSLDAMPEPSAPGAQQPWSETAEAFSRRGRSMLDASSYVSREYQSHSAGFAHFVLDRWAVGGFVSFKFMHFRTPDPIDQRAYDVAGGLQTLWDQPVTDTLSLLLRVRAGYGSAQRSVESPSGGDTDDINGRELQASGASLLSVHLRENLVLGAGPEIRVHRRLGDSSPFSLGRPLVVEGGLTSTLAASF